MPAAVGAVGLEAPISLGFGATCCIRRIETIWRRISGTIAVRTTSVVRMIEDNGKPKPVKTWIPTISSRNALEDRVEQRWQGGPKGSALILAGFIDER